MRSLRVVELFAGIGAQRMALNLAGIPHEVRAICEINKHALASYQAIYGDCPNLGDITKVEALPPCDLVTYSFPCQDLSLAGKRKGMGEGTRSGLVWEVMRLLEKMEKRPEWLLMENVPQVLTSPLWPDLLRRLEAMGYRNRWAKLDSSKFGSAQKRVRAFMVSRLDAEPPEIPTSVPDAPSLCLRDIMVPTRDERYIKRIPLERIKWREPKKGYNHPQSEGLDCPLIDASDPGMETRRIASEDSLCPAQRTGCPQRVVTEEEEERVAPLVEKAENLRMVPRGRKAVGTVKDGEERLVVAPSDKAGESTPVAEDTGQSFYSRKMLYSPSQSSPTIRPYHGDNYQIKVIEGEPGSSTPVAEVDGVVYYPERSLYSPNGSSPTVCTDHGNNRIQVVADIDRPGVFDQCNCIYSSDDSCPSIPAATNTGNRSIKVMADYDGKEWKMWRCIYEDDSMSPTLPHRLNSKQTSIKVVANMEREGWYRMANAIYSDEGNAPTVVQHGGGGRDIMVVAEDTSKAYGSSAKILSPDSSSPTLRSQVHGLQNQPKVLDDGSFDFDFDDKTELVPRMEEGDVCPMLTPGRKAKRQNGQRYRGPNTPAFTVTCQDHNGAASVQGDDLVVNVLTPLECWRLMGFPDWAYERAAEVSSETQLYNQAGNSIVVEVLMAIFRAMFSDEAPKGKRQTTLEGFI